MYMYMFLVRVICLCCILYESDSYSCLFERGVRSVYNREELASYLHWASVCFFLLLSLIIAFRLPYCKSAPLLSLQTHLFSLQAHLYSLQAHVFSLHAHLFRLQAHLLLPSGTSLIAFRLVSYCLQAHLLSFRLTPYPQDFSLYSLQAPLLQTNTIIFLFEHVSEQEGPPNTSTNSYF